MKVEPYNGQGLAGCLSDTVLRFTATWCGPCRVYAHVFDKTMAGRPEHAFVVDIDANMDLAAELGVQSVPATVVLRDGAVVAFKSGVMRQDDLLKLIDEA